MEVKPEKLFIILPFDESSKKIIEALNNDTARKILEVLSEEALSTSQIAEKLNLVLLNFHIVFQFWEVEYSC